MEMVSLGMFHVKHCLLFPDFCLYFYLAFKAVKQEILRGK